MTAYELTFAEQLALLDCRDDDTTEHISVCHSSGPQSFSSAVMLPKDAPGHVGRLIDFGHHRRAPSSGPVDYDFWFSMNPTGPVHRGRGRASAVIRLAATYADVDYGKPNPWDNPPENYTQNPANPIPEIYRVWYPPDLATAERIVGDISGVLGTEPTYTTYSGHGLQPVWAIERESAAGLSNAEAERLLRHFGEVAKAVASRYGCRIDPIYDLARILRVAQTLNCKDRRNKVPVRCLLGTGRAMTVEAARDALAASGVEERRPKERTQGQSRGGKPFTRKCLTERVRKAPEGTRNRTLYGAAKDAARQDDHDDAMYDALADAAAAAGLGGDEIGPTIESGFERGDGEEPEWPPSRMQTWPTPSKHRKRAVSGTREWQ